jgi:hypothetical protein
LAFAHSIASSRVLQTLSVAGMFLFDALYAAGPDLWNLLDALPTGS